MAYSHQNSKGVTYYLHSRLTQLKGGREQTIYFFAKTIKDGAIDAVPDAYMVSETKNGLPVLKKKKKILILSLFINKKPSSLEGFLF